MLSLGGDAEQEGLRGRDLTPILAKDAAPEREQLERSGLDLAPVLEAEPAESVQDAIHFTYDDHQAATATREAPGQPNRVRAVRSAAEKYAVYFDPEGEAAPEYELYDLERDPHEVDNLLDVHSGKPRVSADGPRVEALRERLSAALARAGTAHPGLDA